MGPAAAMLGVRGLRCFNVRTSGTERQERPCAPAARYPRTCSPSPVPSKKSQSWTRTASHCSRTTMTTASSRQLLCTKYNRKYYISYSTDDTNYLVYANGDSPLGPFTYQGRLLEPVLGWTTHHSIVEFRGGWWLFYHDCELSGGVDHLRSVKMREIFHDGDGKMHVERR